MGMDLIALQNLVVTVELGSITAAADALGLSRPTLSRRLARLEEEAGLPLLHRTSRAVQPTVAGRRLVDGARPLLAELEDLGRRLVDERDSVAGPLRVSVPPILADEVARVLVSLRERHPALEVDLHAGIDRVDLMDAGVDVALRAGRLRESDLTGRRLLSTPVLAVATPATLDRDGWPSTLDDLAAHTLLRDVDGSGSARRRWPLRNGGALSVEGAFVCNDQAALLAATLAHGGIALLTGVSVRDALGQGRLVPVLPQEIGSTLHLHAVYAGRPPPARVRAFIDAVVAAFT